MTTRDVTVVNQLGMHARAAAKFVHLASRFESRVVVGRDGREMDGKSIMGLMMLAAGRGEKIKVTTEGTDAEAAMADIEGLINGGFGDVE